MEEPFLFAVKDTLGDRFSERIEQIYQVAIRLIITTLVNECDKRRLINNEETTKDVELSLQDSVLN